MLRNHAFIVFSVRCGGSLHIKDLQQLCPFICPVGLTPSYFWSSLSRSVCTQEIGAEGFERDKKCDLNNPDIVNFALEMKPFATLLSTFGWTKKKVKKAS